MQELDSTSIPTATSVSLPEGDDCQVSSRSLPEGKDYHAFICFNIADQELVDKTIAHLESPQIGFKCVDHRRDFHAGKTTIRNIEEFIEKSWKYILILSPDFVTSEWCSFETDVMMNMSLEQREECIIPVLLKPCVIPRSLRSLTYIDVSQRGGWRDRLVKAIGRTDISSKRTDLSPEKMKQLLDESRDMKEKIKQNMKHYQQEKTNIRLEEQATEKQINNIFDKCIKNMQILMDKCRHDKIEELHFHMDKRRSGLVQKRDTAQKLLFYLESDFKTDAKPLKNFTSLLDEYEEIGRRDGDVSSFTEFVESDELVEKMTELMSDYDVGHLREVVIPYIKSQEDRDILLKERELSSVILPTTGELNQSSIVQCPYFQYDQRTLMNWCTLLPDGSLYNKTPSRTHPPSERRLKEYFGAVGTTRFAPNGIYYWVNKLDVNLEQPLQETMLVTQVVLSSRGVFDENAYTVPHHGALVTFIDRCKDHDKESVCLKMFKDDTLTFHQRIFANENGQWRPLVLGFLLDMVRHRWTLFDVTKEEMITMIEDIPDTEEFTPMFGVYAGNCGSVKLSLVTGKDLNISDKMSTNIQWVLD